MKRVAVLAAVRDELAPTLRAVRRSPPTGLELVTRVTGMGPTRVLAALAELGSLDHLLLVGFSAGLSDAAAGGSVHRPRWVMDEAGHVLALNDGVPRPAEAAARSAADTLITLRQVVHAPTGKRDLGQRHRAAIADMETFAVAAEAARRGLTLTVIRAVSDPVAMTLPDAIDQWVSPTGRSRAGKAAWYALSHPGCIGTLRQLQVNTTAGARGMASEVLRTLASL
jgi:nucleoside phosphorylase